MTNMTRRSDRNVNCKDPVRYYMISSNGRVDRMVISIVYVVRKVQVILDLYMVSIGSYLFWKLALYLTCKVTEMGIILNWYRNV
jgi:hypothetical protein